MVPVKQAVTTEIDNANEGQQKDYCRGRILLKYYLKSSALTSLEKSWREAA